MHTIKVEFLISAVRKDQFPTRDLPEVAFAGRSNVGKSSLINTLLGKKQVARVSSTPGRTQTINFYLVNERWMFVDLPGYGYAKVSEALRASWKKLIQSYLEDRPGLQGVVLIVDARREPMDSDVQLKEYLAASGIPFLIVATKVDKLSKQMVSRQVAAIARVMQIPQSAILRFSAVTGEGRQELWEEIRHLMEEGEKRMKQLRKEKEAKRTAKNAPDTVPVIVAREDGSLDRSST